MKTNVSLEMITARMDRNLGPRIQAVVQRWIDRKDYATPWAKEDLLELGKIVKEETNMDVKFRIDDYPEPNAWIGVLTIKGHQGTSYTDVGSALSFVNKPWELKEDKLIQDYATVKIDLDKVWVEGSIYKNLENELSITKGLLKHPRVDLDAEEITSVILHELGHCFNQYMTLGDYVYLNYVLQDGVEVLLGRKANVYKLEVLTRKGLEKYSASDNLKKEVRTTTSEAKLRQAILSAAMQAPRHHLSGQRNPLSELREEQLADLFASRMGYGKASVSFGDKMARLYGTQYLRDRKTFALGEFFKLVTGAGALLGAVIGLSNPGGWVAAAILFELNRLFDFADGDSAPYDNQYERLVKFRRDIVNQLKTHRNDKKISKAILDDIKVIDGILASYRNNVTAWEVISSYIFSGKRKFNMQREKEEQLERLLLNDMIVASAKFNSLLSKA